MEIYVHMLTGKKFTLEVESSDTVYSVKMKVSDREGIPPGQHWLVFAGKRLRNRRTLADSGISDKSKIFVHYTLTGGGFCTHFVDLENKDARQRIAFTSGQGKEWSKVTGGLNIEGKCTQSSCEAYAKRVISQMQFRAFDISRERSTCPMCFCTIEASSCGFVACQWMYSGRKRGSAIVITSEWQVAAWDKYERFREAGNVAAWEVLIIRTMPIPSSKPDCEMCLDDMMSGQDHQSLECGCWFHRDCVTSWKVRETHCPICRIELRWPNISTQGREGMPDISMEGRETRPNISMEGRETRSNILMEGTRPERRSRFQKLLIWLNVVSN